MLLSLLGLAFATTPYDSLLGTTATSAADEYAMGKEYIDSSLWLVGEWKNPAQQRRVDTIVRRLVAASDRPDLIVNAVLLDTVEVNAAALPGGFLMVNRGLLEMLDDDQLAFVLGHEISHVILRHNASTMNLKVAGTAVEELQASRMSQDRATAQARVEDLYLVMASHSRQLELEADLYGLLYSVRAGYPSGAAMSALQEVDAAVGGDVPEERRPWMSHPLTEERVDQLHRGFDGILRVREQFEAGLVLIAEGHHAEAVASFEQFLSIFPHSSAGWANLGAAWMLQEAPAATGVVDVIPVHADAGVTVRGDLARGREHARDALLHALQLEPTDTVTLTALGALARREGKLPEARQILEKVLVQTPGSAAALTNLGNVAADEGKPDEALARWKEARLADPRQPEPAVNLGRVLAKDPKAKKEAIAVWEELTTDPRFGSEAVRALEALGAREKAPVVGGILGARVSVLFRESELPAAAEPDALISLLGPPSVPEPTDPPPFRLMSWPDLGIRAVMCHERLCAWHLRAPSAAGLSGGIALGDAPKEAIAAWGEPTTRRTFGTATVLTWDAVGVRLLATNDVIEELALETALRR